MAPPDSSWMLRIESKLDDIAEKIDDQTTRIVRLETRGEDTSAKLGQFSSVVVSQSDKIVRLETREDESRWKGRMLWGASIGALISSLGALATSLFKRADQP